MIPSRTVFNHRKWIYIELAITRAHSDHGPLVYQPPSAYQSRASSNVFPISSLGASEPTLLSLLPLLSSLFSPCLFPNEDPFVGSVIAYSVRCFLIFPTSSLFIYHLFSSTPDIFFCLSPRFPFSSMYLGCSLSVVWRCCSIDPLALENGADFKPC